MLALTVLPCADPAGADALPALSGPVILTATGLDPAIFPGGRAEFDLPMLKALGAETITTTSIWTEGAHAYTGVPLARMMAYLHATDARFSLHALNDYVIELPATAEAAEAPRAGTTQTPAENSSAAGDAAVDATVTATAPRTESDTVPILAYAMDGAPMLVRDKGPIWVIYPYDEGARYRTDTVYARSVWHLDRIDVLR